MSTDLPPAIGFYEDDEDPATVRRAFATGERGVTVGVPARVRITKSLPHEPAQFADDLDDPNDATEFGMHELNQVRSWRSVGEMIADWWRGRD